MISNHKMFEIIQHVKFDNIIIRPSQESRIYFDSSSIDHAHNSYIFLTTNDNFSVWDVNLYTNRKSKIKELLLCIV